jgi:hypothetical protein
MFRMLSADARVELPSDAKAEHNKQFQALKEGKGSMLDKWGLQMCRRVFMGLI